MIKIITFATDNMTIAAEICRESALRNNIHRVDVFGLNDIDRSFYKKNKLILDQPLGAGYWLWKPYFIDKVMNMMDDGDILIYSDAGVEIINNVNFIIDRMDQDIFLFGNQYQHEHWCRYEAIKAISPKCKFGKQVQASVIFIRISNKSKEFVKHWLRFCQVPELIMDGPPHILNHTEFREHRHDQAILTCLAYADGIKLHWWPAVYNGSRFTYGKDGYSDNYPVIFHHHRMRNEEFKDRNHFCLNYILSKKYDVLK